MSEDSQRIDKLEAKIDKLIDAVTELVVVQSDVRNINLRLNSHAIDIKKNDERLDEIEKKLPVYDILVTVSGWTGRIILTLLITGIVGSYIAFGGK